MYLIDGLSDRLRFSDPRKELNIVLVTEKLLHPFILTSEGLGTTNNIHKINHSQS